ncbi:MAG: hypothetical protein IJX91_05065 [Clostridia bacterium]|nr:hypothetical protein [Clostridia bacterium]
MWSTSKHHIRKDNIDLDGIKVKNGNPKAYTLLYVAKDIPLGSSEIVASRIRDEIDVPPELDIE